MELNALARRILYGTSLEDKLWTPESLSDRRPGSPQPAPRLPARPRALRLEAEPARARLRLPGTRELEEPRARARLLHHFANHELLAVELMALCLLRFPEAPASFRRGVAHTLAEEQSHLRLYLERMAELGLGFGEAPLSGFFWSCLSGMQHPLDYVVGMGLTFEQANLDHAQAYARAFAQVGDAESAALLERIQREEIAHVRYGLQWFRRWREPGPNEWEAYRAALSPPLTPMRAKGRVFLAEPRREAGLGEAFIRELRVYAHSKGRPPRVHWANLGCELELPAGAQLRAPLRALRRDYGGLLRFVAGRDDLLLVPRLPSLAYREQLAALGFPPRELLELPQPSPAHLRQALRGREHAGLAPWGWSPAACELAAAVKTGLRTDSPPELTLVRELADKALAAELLAAFRAAHPELQALLGPAEQVGRVVRDREAAAGAVQALGAAGYARVVLKARWGTSGQGMLRLVPGEAPSAPQEGWLRRTLAQQGALVVEPWLEDARDLSLQLRVGGASRPRLTRFFTDARGQYLGHVVGRPLSGLESGLLRALHGGGRPGLLALLHRAGRFVARELERRGYRGPAGLDALVHRHGGAWILKPLSELNPRVTMGQLAEGLARHLRPGRVGLWVHVSAGAARAQGCAGLAELAARLPPPVARGAPLRLEAGVLCTNDPARAESRLGLLAVAPTLAGCRELLGQLAPPESAGDP